MRLGIFWETLTAPASACLPARKVNTHYIQISCESRQSGKSTAYLEEPKENGEVRPQASDSAVQRASCFDRGRSNCNTETHQWGWSILVGQCRSCQVDSREQVMQLMGVMGADMPQSHLLKPCSRCS